MTFEEILIEHGIPIAPAGHHHTRPGWLNFDCPFCGRDTAKYHMGYSLAYNYTVCWQCGPHPVIEVIKDITGLGYREAKALLAGIRIDYVEPTRKPGKLTLPAGIKPLDVLPQHQHYLEGRGYDYIELEHLWHLAGIGLAPRLAWRIFIPIYLHGAVVSWTTRTISNDPSTLRYVSASAEEESVSHKTILYGEDYARHAIAIQEGPTGVWRIGPGAVATCGVGFKQAQVLRMAKYPVRAVCFDNEKEAQKRAKRLVEALSIFPGDTFNVVWETGKDAGEVSDKEIQQLRKEILQ